MQNRERSESKFSKKDFLSIRPFLFGPQTRALHKKKHHLAHSFIQWFKEASGLAIDG
jgi:hypothetical protein